MEEKRIKEEILNLDWNNEEEVQKRAIEFLSKIDPKYYHLIFSEGYKQTWENSMEIVRRIGYPQNIPFIPDLLQMMQDINWPGARMAVDILCAMDLDVLQPQLERTITTAFNDNDDMWLMGLDILVEEWAEVHGTRFPLADIFYEQLKTWEPYDSDLDIDFTVKSM